MRETTLSLGAQFFLSWAVDVLILSHVVTPTEGRDSCLWSATCVAVYLVSLCRHLWESDMQHTAAQLPSHVILSAGHEFFCVTSAFHPNGTKQVNQSFYSRCYKAQYVERQNGQGSVPPDQSFRQLETVCPTLFISTLISSTYPRRRPTVADNKDVVCLAWSVRRGDQWLSFLCLR